MCNAKAFTNWQQVQDSSKALCVQALLDGQSCLHVVSLQSCAIQGVVDPTHTDRAQPPYPVPIQSITIHLCDQPTNISYIVRYNNCLSVCTATQRMTIAGDIASKHSATLRYKNKNHTSGDITSKHSATLK